MGILDDAIREHLELKRKHGAPEQELQRQEEEALGPVRREVAAQQPQDGGTEEEAPAPAPEPAEAAEPTPVEAEPEPESEPVEAPDFPEPVAEIDKQAPEPKADHPPPEPVFDPSPDEAPPTELPETPARGFAPVEEEEEPPPEGEADVLEDTPDFLQETPEHDRLWFEQKPPRDFDFD